MSRILSWTWRPWAGIGWPKKIRQDRVGKPKAGKPADKGLEVQAFQPLQPAILAGHAARICISFGIRFGNRPDRCRRRPSLTPLNHIIGFTELLVDKRIGALSGVQEEYLNDVLNSSRHLLSLINDILDISKVEAGKLELEATEVDLHTLVESSLRMVKEKAIKHRIDLRSELGRLPGPVKADERKLRQILYNLISNAVKFTPDGGLVKVCGEPVNGSLVKVSVLDTGIGIKAEDLQRIFEPFEQADNSSSRKFQDTGLGLSLAKKFVELHGGKIWAESKGEGQGSTFSFIIPM
jgi:signal transduction histidine kinase